MAGFCETDYGCTGRLTLNGTLMHNPAWVTPLLTRLWWDREYRGESTQIPGAPGRRANPKRIDEIAIELPIYINGWVDTTGAPHPDPWQGLELNLRELETDVLSPTAVGVDPDRGTIAASLLTPAGVTLTADVQVESLEFQEIEDPTWQVGILTLLLPDGLFA